MNGLGVDELENNRIEGGTDGTEIGNTSDRLNIKGDPVDQNEVLDVLGDILRQLKIMNTYLAEMTEIELTDGDEGDAL
jgi:hypothetical protein